MHLLGSSQAHLGVATSCVLYLISSLELVNTKADRRAVLDRIGKCFHDLQGYANDHWLDHTIHVAKSLGSLRNDQLQDQALHVFFESLTLLAKLHKDLLGAKDRGGNPYDEDPSQVIRELVDLQVSNDAKELMMSLASFRDVRDQTKTNVTTDPTLFSDIRSKYEALAEEIIDTPADQYQEFKLRHSSGVFYCRHIECLVADHIFNSREARNKHEDSHNPQYKCMDISCSFFQKPFNSLGAKKHHEQKYHDISNVNSIPNSVRRTGQTPQEDRTLFKLSETQSIEKPAGEEVDPELNGVRTEAQLAEHPTTLAEDPSTTFESRLKHLSLVDVPSEYQQSGNDWEVIYNPSIPRQDEIQLVESLEHSGVVCSVCVSNDGKFIATGSNRVARVFSTVEYGQTAFLFSHDIPTDGDNYVRDLHFDPTSTKLFAGYEKPLVIMVSISIYAIHLDIRIETTK